MATKTLILTDNGKKKAFAADTNGVKINIKHIAIGDAEHTPSSTITALVNEKMRAEILSKETHTDNYQVTLNTSFPKNSESFYVKEFGIFLDDGTLFAIWSETGQTNPTQKNKDTVLLQSISINLLDSVNPSVINIIDQGADLKLNFTTEFNSMNTKIDANTACCTLVKTQITELKTWTEQQIANATAIVAPTVTAGLNNDITITSTFTSSDNFTGTHDKSVFQAFSDSAHTTKLNEGIITSGNLLTYAFSNIPLNTEVFYRVAVGSDNHLSNWTTGSFTSSSASIATPTAITVAGSPTSVGDKAESTLTALPTAIECTINRVEFKCLRKSDSSQVGTTLSTSTLILPIKFDTPDGLVVSTEYKWMWRCGDTGASVWSNWGELEATTNSTFINKLDIFNDGSALALYTFNDNALDTGGIHNGVWHGTEAYGTGKFGNAINVMDSNNCVEINVQETITTVSLWANRDHYNGSNNYLVDFRLDSNADTAVIIGGVENSDYSTKVYIVDSASITLEIDGVVTTSGASIPSDNAWHHYLITFSSYNPTKFMLGYYHNLADTDNDYAFGGYIDHVRIFNKALTSAEKQILREEGA